MGKLEKRKALVLAGGEPQIALIKELQNRGYYVLLADYNEAPVAKSYADEFFQISTLDVEAITDLAKQHNIEFLITACTDQALLTVANVSEKLSLPCYIDYQTALMVTNKAYMKEVLTKNEIKTPKYVIKQSIDNLKIESLKFPMIVKPVDCNSSKGVKRANDLVELKGAFCEARKLSRTSTVIIEELIEGVELSIDVYVEDGNAHVLCISKLEKINDKEKFVIFRGICPANISKIVEKQIRMISQQIAVAFKLKNSPMLIQVMVKNEQVYVLEFSARTGGGMKHIKIKEVSGFDVIKAVVNLTLGIKNIYCNSITWDKLYIDEFIYCKNGIFDHLEGFEELKQEGIIERYSLFKWRGAEFDIITNSGDRVAGFTVKGTTKDEVLYKHDIVSKRIAVIDNYGNDIMRHDLLMPLNM